MASPPPSQARQGQIITPSLSSLAPSAVCPGPFSMRDIPKALLPGWLLVSLLDTGQLKLGANCSLCWPSGPRRAQFRLICEVTPLENANSATVDRETHTINFLSESGTTKFPIPTLTCRHTQVTNGGFHGKMNGRTLLEALQEKKERRVEATNTAIAADRPLRMSLSRLKWGAERTEENRTNTS